jgi:hypothetical protein
VWFVLYVIFHYVCAQVNEDFVENLREQREELLGLVNHGLFGKGKGKSVSEAARLARSIALREQRERGQGT